MTEVTSKITINDVRRAGYCAMGARGWFRGHNLDFNDFLKNGIDEETFLATGDHLAQNVVEKKRQQEQRDG